MNPNIDRNTLAAIDHHDYTHDSGLALDYFRPVRDWRGELLIVAAIIIAIAGVTLYYFAGMQ